ncbi:unnamed protein product [Victoria cruziana]
MARASGAILDFIDMEPSRFIAAGKLHCSVDEAAGARNKPPPDARNALHQSIDHEAGAHLTEPDSFIGFKSIFENTNGRVTVSCRPTRVLLLPSNFCLRNSS